MDAVKLSDCQASRCPLPALEIKKRSATELGIAIAKQGSGQGFDIGLPLMTGEDWRFLVRLRIGESDRVDGGEIRRLIVYLGGIGTDEEYLFPSAARRAEAIGVLASKFGLKYFVLDEAEARSL